MRRSWWWVYRIFQGKLIVLGPCRDEDEGHEWGRNRLQGEYKIVELNTIDKRNAKGKIAAMVLAETDDLELALKKASYKGVGETGAEVPRQEKYVPRYEED